MPSLLYYKLLLLLLLHAHCVTATPRFGFSMVNFISASLLFSQENCAGRTRPFSAGNEPTENT